MRIREKTIPENKIAITEYTEEGLNNSLYDVFEWAKTNKIIVNGVPFARIENIEKTNSERICGLSIKGENLNPPENIQVIDDKKHKVIGQIHIGSHKTVKETYKNLIEYAKEKNYKNTKTVYLIFINNPFYTDEEKLITEVQLVITE